jgi:hypothetical protein
MKKQVVLTMGVLLLTFFNMNGQIKVETGGTVKIGQSSYPGGGPVQKLYIDGGEGGAALFKTSHTEDANWNTMAWVNRDLAKSWIVLNGGNDLTGSHNFFVFGTGDTWVKNTYVTSDSMLKKDIKNIEDSSLRKLLLLRGVSYKFKMKEDFTAREKKKIFYQDAKNNKKTYGLLAQDLEKVFPEMVKYDTDSLRAICYEQLIPVLIESIKSQQVEIELLSYQIRRVAEVNGVKLDSINSKTYKSLGKSLLNTDSMQNITHSLSQNKPNPWGDETVIDYNIPSNTKTSSIIITDLNGSLKKQFSISKTGSGKITLRSSDLTPGLYLYSLVLDDNIVDTRKMLLSKK